MAIWGVSLALLVPLALLGLSVKASYRATGELAPTSSSVQGLAIIQKHFTAGEVGPVTVLLESSTDWDSPQGRRVLGHLTRVFGYLDNVAEVRSLTQPLGPEAEVRGQKSEVRVHQPSALAFGSLLTDKATAALKKVSDTIDESTHKAARQFYEAKIDTPAGERYVTRLDVVLKTDPFDPHSVPTLDMLQTWLRDRLPGDAAVLGDVRAETYGVTVNARDLATVTESDRMRINGLVLAGIFLILLVLVRRPWLAGYLLVTVLLSYYATLGATTLLAHWWHARPLGEVDWRVPFFLFTILVAVGEDYNILLMTRALKEKKRRGTDDGMRRALARTGGTITSCGLIMAGTFATLMLAGLNTLIQIGFALAFGVLLDTFVVRPFLVPALTLVMWRRQETVPEPAPVKLRLIIPPREFRRAA
jgi:RND superfamily putative drug exporter